MIIDHLPAHMILAAARQEGAAADLRCRALLERAASDRVLHAAFRRELAHGGLTESGFSVLVAVLAHAPGSLPRVDLADAAGLSPVRATHALTRLEMSRLVRRHRDERDRRLIWLSLTPEGTALINDSLRRCVSVATRVAGFMDDEQLRASIALSHQLRREAERLLGESVIPALA